MGNDMKKDAFISFAQKAVKKLEERKKQRKEKIYIPDLDETISIVALTDQEIAEVTEYSSDDSKNDKYMIYMSSPDLQELAKELKEQDKIKEHIEVVDIFKLADRRAIAKKILEISGIYEESNIEMIRETEEIKN